MFFLHPNTHDDDDDDDDNHNGKHNSLFSYIFSPSLSIACLKSTLFSSKKTDNSRHIWISTTRKKTSTKQ